MIAFTRRGLAALLTVGLAACGGDGPTAPRDAASAGIDAGSLASRVQGPRPLAGRLTGFGLAGDPCSISPPGVLVTATGHGTVRHFGATTLVQTVCVSVPDFLPLGPSFVSLTAANRDRADGVVIDVAFRSDGFDMVVAITGGTGRFFDAGGAYAVSVLQSAPLQPFSATIEGWIEY